MPEGTLRGARPKERAGASPPNFGGILDRRPDRRFLWPKVVLALGLASSFLISYKTWVATRYFPLTPVWDWFSSPAYPLDYVVFGVMLLPLVPIAVLRRPRWFILGFAAVAGLVALWDQQRWQPWFYQYLFMLGALALYGSGSPEVNREKALNACRVVVVGIYLWSGLQKVNAGFVQNIYPWLTGPLVEALPPAIGDLVGATPFMGPLVEITIALGLLTRRFRNPAVLLTIALHTFILFSIGPFGLMFNTVVWPWNVAAATATVLLFWRTPQVSFRGVFGGGLFNKLVIVLFLVMPFLNFFGMWDSFLSATLYSGHTKRAVIYTSDEARGRMPQEMQQYFEAGGGNAIRVISWSFAELNTPVFPEDRIFRSALDEVCNYARTPTDVSMVVREVPNYLTGEAQMTAYSCQDVQE